MAFSPVCTLKSTFEKLLLPWAHPRSVNQNLWGGAWELLLKKKKKKNFNMLPRWKTTGPDQSGQLWGIYANNPLSSSQNVLNNSRILCIYYIRTCAHCLIHSRCSSFIQLSDSWGWSGLVTPSISTSVLQFILSYEKITLPTYLSFAIWIFRPSFLILSAAFSLSFPWCDIC